MHFLLNKLWGGGEKGGQGGECMGKIGIEGRNK